MKKYLDIVSWFLLFFFAPFTILILLSQNSIPGDTFYPVKRGLENGILAVASISPTTKVAFRTDLTGRRFSEAQQLLVGKADTTAFADFVSEVSTTQQDLSALSSSQDKIQKADVLIAKIDEYQVQLSQTQNQVASIASATTITIQPFPSSNPTAQPVQNQKVCVQIIAYAKNPQSGVCTSFSTPCDIPDGWEKCSPPTPTDHAPGQIPPPPGPGQSVPPENPRIGTSSISPNSTPAPTIAPTASNDIAQNPIKREEVKNKISDTKEELEKIKVKLKKEKEDSQLKEKIKEEQNKLKEEIKNAPAKSPRNK